MKPKISIVAGTRDDKFGDGAPTRYNLGQKLNNDERINMTIRSLLSQFEDRDIDVEYVLVDFSPVSQNYLHTNEVLRETLSDPRVKNVIVDSSACVKKGLHESAYYEYFAKNVGMRNANGEFILITNPDNLFENKLVDGMAAVVDGFDKSDGKFVVTEQGSPVYFRPYARKDSTYFLKEEDAKTMLNGLYGPNRISTLGWHDSISFDDRFSIEPAGPGYLVSHAMGITFKNADWGGGGDRVGTGASGDFVFAQRELFFNIAGGYDESSPIRYRPFHLDHMDSELVMKFYRSGCVPIEFPGCLLSLDHFKPSERTGPYNQGVYSNAPDWGMAGYKTNQINANTIMIVGD